MTLNDRLTRGFFAGILAGIPAYLVGLILRFVFHATTLNFPDWAAIMIFGKKAETLLGQVFSVFVASLFWGFLGIVFAYIIHYVSSKNLFLKGLIWGALVWFVIYAITLLFKVPGLLTIAEKTSISQLVEALIYGGFLAIFFKYLDRKVKS